MFILLYPSAARTLAANSGNFKASLQFHPHPDRGQPLRLLFLFILLVNGFSASGSGRGGASPRMRTVSLAFNAHDAFALIQRTLRGYKEECDLKLGVSSSRAICFTCIIIQRDKRSENKFEISGCVSCIDSRLRVATAPSVGLERY